MSLTNLRWADETHTAILAEDSSGRAITIPADPGNRDYDLLINGRPAQHEAGIAAIAPAVIADPN